jgi:antirestriction protein ArdC
MGNQTVSRRAGSIYVYAIVTDKIISLLETGVVPWGRPWVNTGLPRDLISKKGYRGRCIFDMQLVYVTISRYFHLFSRSLRCYVHLSYRMVGRQ